MISYSQEAETNVKRHVEAPIHQKKSQNFKKNEDSKQHWFQKIDDT